MRLERQQLGQYRLLRPLVVGGMSDTYLAETMTIPSRKVAIKILCLTHLLRSPEPEVERRFLGQIEAISQLQHPFIVPIHDYGQVMLRDESYFYITMPFFSEGSLREWWKRQLDSKAEPVLPQEVAHMIQQAADALQYAHDRHIIHQHIQLSNFLVRSQKDSSHLPDLLLTDFVTTEFGRLSPWPAPFSLSPYIAPEQLRGKAVPASDQYALASIAYQLLTGHFCVSLHVRESPSLSILMVQPPPPSIFQPHLSSALDAVLLRALSKKSEERFASITGFSHAFQHAWHI
jgi:serine/threonine protein kinase